MTAGSVAASITLARDARNRACAWLLGRVGPDGEPECAATGNSWSRLPWAFALCGEAAAGHAVLNWVARHGLREDGDLAATAIGSGRMGAYPLGHLAMGALLLERHDVARRLFDRLAKIQTPSGGFPLDPPGADFAHITDLLSTAQAGTAAILAGRRDIYEPAYRWIALLRSEQPEFSHRLLSARTANGLVTEPPKPLAWIIETDFSKPRQTYYTSGIAAVFLAAYAQTSGSAEARTMGHEFLRLNIEGTSEQFDDLASVQACKFAWGLAAMHITDPRANYVPWLQKMVSWFIARQDDEGAWRPSTFISPSPSQTERMVKTAEHIMELNWTMAALAINTGCNDIPSRASAMAVSA